MEKRPSTGWIRTLGLFSVIIAEIVGGTVGGILAGYAAWKYLGFPQLTMLFTGMAGFSLGLYRVYRVSQKLWKDTDRENGNES